MEITVLTHEAMATTFKLSIAHADRKYARQAAAEAFAELDRIEQNLSRFIEGGDIFRLNRLSAGSDAIVSPATFHCLQIALEMQRATVGAFDITYASDCASPQSPSFKLDDSIGAVRLLRNGVKIDLGAIGKGFALDCMAVLLPGWDIDSALLCASDSTILALGAPPDQQAWTVSIGPARNPLRVNITRSAVSASGRAVRGDHITDPRTGGPGTHWWRCWSTAATAAVADALSTAFMVMSESEILAHCRSNPAHSAYAIRGENADLFVARASGP